MIFIKNKFMHVKSQFLVFVYSLTPSSPPVTLPLSLTSFLSVLSIHTNDILQTCNLLCMQTYVIRRASSSQTDVQRSPHVNLRQHADDHGGARAARVFPIQPNPTHNGMIISWFKHRGQNNLGSESTWNSDELSSAVMSNEPPNKHGGLDVNEVLPLGGASAWS